MNFLFIFFSVLGSIICLSSSSSMMMWVGMEISSFFFIPILLNTSSTNSSWKYFVSQGFSSLLFFLGWVSGELSSSMDYFLVSLSLLIKLGSFPFYGWVMHLAENLSWMSFFLVTTIQKLPPLVVLCKISDLLGELFIYLSLFNLLSVVLFFFSNLSTRWMMMYSSIFNMSWMISSASLGVGSLMVYLFVYFSFNLMLIWFFSLEGSMSSFSWFKFGSSKWSDNFSFSIVVFSLMGIPPMGTFIGKLEVLLNMMNSSLFFISFLFIFFASVVVFFYIKMTYGKFIILNSSELSRLFSGWNSSLLILPMFFMSIFWFL